MSKISDFIIFIYFLPITFSACYRPGMTHEHIRKVAPEMLPPRI